MIILVVLLLLGTAAAQRESVCGPNGQRYDPQVYSCCGEALLTRELTDSNRVMCCGNRWFGTDVMLGNWGCCGTTVYDKGVQNCNQMTNEPETKQVEIAPPFALQGVNQGSILVPSQPMCGATEYDAETNICCDGNLYAKQAGQNVTRVARCCDAVAYAFTADEERFWRCCRSISYDTRQQICEGGFVRLRVPERPGILLPVTEKPPTTTRTPLTSTTATPVEIVESGVVRCGNEQIQVSGSVQLWQCCNEIAFKVTESACVVFLDNRVLMPIALARQYLLSLQNPSNQTPGRRPIPQPQQPGNGPQPQWPFRPVQPQPQPQPQPPRPGRPMWPPTPDIVTLPPPPPSNITVPLRRQPVDFIKTCNGYQYQIKSADRTTVYCCGNNVYDSRWYKCDEGSKQVIAKWQDDPVTPPPQSRPPIVYVTTTEQPRVDPLTLVQCVNNKALSNDRLYGRNIGCCASTAFYTDKYFCCGGSLYNRVPPTISVTYQLCCAGQYIHNVNGNPSIRCCGTSTVNTEFEECRSYN